LKQARHRASRRFLNDGAKSSLPQYLHTKASEVLRDVRFDGRAPFAPFGEEAIATVFLAVVLCRAAALFGLAPISVRAFLAVPSTLDFVSMTYRISFRAGLWLPLAVLSTHRSVAALREVVRIVENPSGKTTNATLSP
jgi:hypothetical protein